MKKTNRDADVIVGIRNALDSEFTLRYSASAALVATDPETCYQRGLNAMSDAIAYGSVCRSMDRATRFLLMAEESLDAAIRHQHYPALLQGEPPTSVAYEKSVAAFCRFAAKSLLTGEADNTDLTNAVRVLDEVLSEEAITDAASPRRPASEIDDWTRYGVRYLGLIVLCRICGSEAAARSVRLVRTVSFCGKYADLVGALLTCLDEQMRGQEVGNAYERAYHRFFCIDNFRLSLVCGFPLWDVLLFSAIRCGGEFNEALLQMFHAEGT